MVDIEISIFKKSYIPNLSSNITQPCFSFKEKVHFNNIPSSKVFYFRTHLHVAQCMQRDFIATVELKS